MRPFDQSDLSHVIDKSIKWFKLHRFLSGEYLLIVLRISHQTSRMSFRMCAHRIPAGAKVVKIDRIARRIEWTKTKATNCSCWHVFFNVFVAKKYGKTIRNGFLKDQKKYRVPWLTHKELMSDCFGGYVLLVRLVPQSQRNVPVHH